MFRNSRFEKLLAKSTSELLMEPDWETNLQVCDMVRGQEATPKYALSALKKKLTPETPHVLMLSLSVLEALMKNCGTPIHDEVVGTEFVMELLEYTHLNEEIRSRIFGFIQNWEFAFKKNAKYAPLHEAFNEIKRSGHPLPPFCESEAMFSAEVAPDWKDGEECYRCKANFSTFKRKHHCRNCGNVFCGDCTSGRAGIPKYGIEKEVRVCDTCLYQLTKHGNTSGTPGSHREDAHHAHRSALDHLGKPHQQQQQQQERQKKREQMERERVAKEKELQLREEEELQLALALSASEAEAKPRGGGGIAAHSPTGGPRFASGSKGGTPVAADVRATPPPTVTPVDLNGGGTEVDPELAHYLNRHYWTNRAAANTADSDSFLSGFSPSAPSAFYPPPPVNPDYEPSLPDTAITSSLAGGGAKTSVPPEGSALPGVPALTSAKQEEFLDALRRSLGVFTNRMRVNTQRNRPITSDSTLQTLLQTLHQMHPQILQYSSDLATRRAYLEHLQDQATQVRDSREALDALRREYAEQHRREQEEAHRQRQIQMMQKVEVLRQQKRHALEAQHRQVMEQTMAYQQQYGQQPMYAGGPYGGAPMMAPPPHVFGVPGPQPSSMMPNYGSAGAYPPPEYAYAAAAVAGTMSMQQPYDSQLPLSEQQQPSQPPTLQMDMMSPQPPAPTEQRSDTNGAFAMGGMMQALPPPVQPPLQYISHQPGPPAAVPEAPAPSTTASSNFAAVVESLPLPPTDALPSAVDAGGAAPDANRKPPTPQLICFE